MKMDLIPGKLYKVIRDFIVFDADEYFNWDYNSGDELDGPRSRAVHVGIF